MEKVVSGGGGGETVGVLATDKIRISRNGTNAYILTPEEACVRSAPMKQGALF